MKYNGIFFNNGICLIPKLGYLAKHNKEIKGKSEFGIVEAEDIDIYNMVLNSKKSLLDNRKIRGVSIVPTTECNGRCSYCYAKASREIKDNYLEPEVLRETIKDFQEDIEMVIVYGGDSLIYPDKLEKLILEFKDSCSVDVVTGLMYDDEAYEKLGSLLDKYKNLSICISLDPHIEPYTRYYPGVESTFEFVFNRSVDLLKRYKNRIGFRMTVTPKNADFTAVLERLTEESGVDPIMATVELVEQDEILNEDIKYLSDQLAKYNDKHNKAVLSPSRRFKFDPIKNPERLLNFSGDCSQIYDMITVDNTGRIHACPEEATYNDKTLMEDFNNISEELLEKRSAVWDKCKDCELLMLCGGLCFIKEPTNSRCVWRGINIVEGLYWTYGTLKGEDIDLAIKANNDVYNRRD